MTAHPIDDPALRDPFFRELRTRHPDVDIVILPQPPIPALPPVPTPVDVAQALEMRARTVLEELIAAAEHAPAGTATGWWRQGPSEAHRFVARCTFTDLGTPIRTMRAIYDRLGDEGWHLRPDDDPRPRFTGGHGPLSVRVDAFRSAVELEVLTEVVTLDRTTLAALEGRR
jgi:hypothetical protein